ncbi:hypothetical protein BGW38_000958 [Lunasporangiospora selenospora]|uniref:Uncharacterized protein n=1 Tax=Lunasporangiospora selenospora TaxID=979761 RepID=A0A9P6KI46_9FUNG|nr:hypothetical protein BGW38_000958 [Lunasporangiospora selenospora]
MSNNNQMPKSKASDSQRPTTVHSTHSFLETFDQVTRDSRLEQQSREYPYQDDPPTSTSAWSPGLSQEPIHPKRQDSSGEIEAMASASATANPEAVLQGVNSAVQLDRDVQHSRRVADENRQKATGGERSQMTSWGSSNEYKYVD